MAMKRRDRGGGGGEKAPHLNRQLAGDWRNPHQTGRIDESASQAQLKAAAMT